MRKENILNMIIYIALIFGLIIILGPLFLTIIATFKTEGEIIRSFISFPDSFYLGNYREVLLSGGFFIACYNSFFVTFFSLCLIITVIPLLSYSLERNSKIKVYKWIYILIMVGIFIPFQMVMLPIVKIISKIHMLNKYGLILIYLGMSVPKMSFLYFGFLKTIPYELEESAFLEGAGILQIFIKIIYPLLKPMTATVVILQGLWIWNDFMIPLIVVNKEDPE